MSTTTDTQVALPDYGAIAAQAAAQQAAMLSFQQQMTNQTLQFQTKSEVLKNMLDSGKSAARNIN